MSLEKSVLKLVESIDRYSDLLEKSITMMENNQGAAATKAAPAKTEAAEEKPAPKKKAPAKKAPAKKAEGPTLEDVKAITLKAVDEFDKAAEVKAIVADYGVKKATLIEEDDFAEYISRVQELIERAGGSDDDEDEDLI